MAKISHNAQMDLLRRMANVLDVLAESVEIALYRTHRSEQMPIESRDALSRLKADVTAIREDIDESYEL